MKRLWMIGGLALVVAALAAVPAGAAAGGNSANAKLCQKGGWKTLFRGDGSTFANQGECVSFAARGGPIFPLASLELALCQNQPQPAGGICVRAVGTGLEPGSTVWITAVNVPLFGYTESQSGIYTVPPSGSIDVIRTFIFTCRENVTTATATGRSADSLSTPVVPGITVTSNTVTWSTGGCP